ncbi:FtsX-like permease family protein [Crocinitomicaceae bacterium]|nr:FtsX-like permease family protein [Crocinitomicaceae bacterium]
MTRVSVVGITVTTAALVILLSAFNGIEEMVEKLYSDFDSDITIRNAKGKTFYENQINVKDIESVSGVKTTSLGLEEVVVLKHEKKWVNANLIGVDANFFDVAKVYEHMVDGYPALTVDGKDAAIIGATLLDKLEGFIPSVGYEKISIFSPKRDMRIRLGKSPFAISRIEIAGRMNYNREVNAEFILVPLNFAQELLSYEFEFSVVFIDVKNGYDNEDVKQDLKAKLGADFEVKTNYEKNELIYKTSQSEKVIVIIILLFVFIIAAFTLVAALTMMFIEKKENLGTLRAIGADKSFIFKILFSEGLLISFKGILIGLVLGYGVCLSQIYGKLLTIPNSADEPFPMRISFEDGFLIITLVSIISILASYLPAKYLLRGDNMLQKKD